MLLLIFKRVTFQFNLMKSIYFYLAYLLLCCDCNGQGWIQVQPLPPGNGLLRPFSFSINGKLYVGGGYVGSGVCLTTLFEYDPATNVWTQKANVPTGQYATHNFVLNGKGYIACGAVPNPMDSVYMYDPIANTWTQKNPFPGTARINGVGFSINGRGYISSGFIGGSSLINDMWEYNDTTDTWTQKANVPGPPRNGPSFLIINNQAYIGVGGDVSTSNVYTDFYRFDPVANSYTQVASMPGGRASGANFTVGNYGYVGLGQIVGSMINDFYRFDPVANTWTQECSFGGGSRAHVFNETVLGLPYVGCGNNVSNTYLSDVWTWAVCNLTVNLGNDTTLCSGETITLIDTFSNAHSLWSTGDTTASITVSASGTYWLRVTQENCTECTGSDTINITFSGSPPAPFSLGNDTIYCGSFTRTLSTGNDSTLWSTGVTASQITVTSPGTYWAEISNPCGSVSDTIVISQNPLPVVNLGNDTNICNSNPITLNATTVGAAYAWQNGTTAPTLTVSSSGIYWVNVTVNGCTKRDSIVVSYISALSFDIGNDTTYCGSFSRVLTAGVAHTIWSTGDTATAITVDTPGRYWGLAYACGDTLTDSITISEKPLPIVNLGNDTAICPGHDVVLNAGNPGAAYQWQNNTTDQTLTVDSPGVYWVDVTVNGCMAPDTIRISGLFPPSAFSIGSDTTICEDSLLILNAYQANSGFIWSTGDTSASIAVSQTGQYQVTDTNSCGSTSAAVSVTVVGCECRLAIPTAFSPNNDGKNDHFWVLTQCPLRNFEMNIYNRWGQLIFTGYAVADKWDGTYKGHQQPLGVYVYFVHYIDPYTGKANSQSGNVTLVR
jgi:gliding motility-associated-like protein